MASSSRRLSPSRGVSLSQDGKSTKRATESQTPAWQWEVLLQLEKMEMSLQANMFNIFIFFLEEKQISTPPPSPPLLRQDTHCSTLVFTRVHVVFFPRTYSVVFWKMGTNVIWSWHRIVHNEEGEQKERGQRKEKMREKEKRIRISKRFRKKILLFNSTVTFSFPQTAAFPLCLLY